MQSFHVIYKLFLINDTGESADADKQVAVLVPFNDIRFR